MQGNWENWRNSFWWSANREFFLSENDFKKSSEIQKFSRENVDIFWWSANRDKFCKVVRESEKVENRCAIGLPLDCEPKFGALLHQFLIIIISKLLLPSILNRPTAQAFA